MSRFYTIVVGAETSTQPGGQPASNAPAITFTNQINGQPNLNGQQIEFDITSTQLAGQAGVTSGSRLTIRGVSIQQIAQAADYNGSSISVSAGMQKGLPLATAAFNQYGEIVRGTIREAYGNWLGVEQSLEFIIMPTALGDTQSNPGNFTFVWKKGQTMQTLIANALAIPYPSPPFTVNININSGLVAPQDIPGQYSTITQFASWVQQQSIGLLAPNNPNYTGVSIAVTGTTINVSDNITAAQTANSNFIQLNAQDFIGQPTWLGPNSIQFNTVLRADINTLSFFKFPTALSLQTQTTPQSLAFARQSTTFAGTWQVQFIRHLGNSRGVNATDWITTYQAVNTMQTAKDAATSNVST